MCCARDATALLFHGKCQSTGVKNCAKENQKCAMHEACQEKLRRAEIKERWAVPVSAQFYLSVHTAPCMAETRLSAA